MTYLDFLIKASNTVSMRLLIVLFSFTAIFSSLAHTSSERRTDRTSLGIYFERLSYVLAASFNWSAVYPLTFFPDFTALACIPFKTLALSAYWLLSCSNEHPNSLQISDFSIH